MYTSLVYLIQAKYYEIKSEKDDIDEDNWTKKIFIQWWIASQLSRHKTHTQRNHNARHQEDKQNDSLISLITDSYTFHIVDT